MRSSGHKFRHFCIYEEILTFLRKNNVHSVSSRGSVVKRIFIDKKKTINAISIYMYDQYSPNLKKKILNITGHGFSQFLQRRSCSSKRYCFVCWVSKDKDEARFLKLHQSLQLLSKLFKCDKRWRTVAAPPPTLNGDSSIINIVL